jgi:hypothetical protein
MWQMVDNKWFDYGLYFEQLVVDIRVPTQLPTILYVTQYEWFEVCVRDLNVWYWQTNTGFGYYIHRHVTCNAYLTGNPHKSDSLVKMLLLMYTFQDFHNEKILKISILYSVNTRQRISQDKEVLFSRLADSVQCKMFKFKYKRTCVSDMKMDSRWQKGG